MKVDGGLPGAGIDEIARVAAGARERRLRRRVDRRDRHDPFFPLLLAAEHTERLELGTGIAVAFARNPMIAGEHRLRPAGVLAGPVHPRARQPDQGAHREAVLDAVVAPGGADARVHPGDARDLGGVERRREARLPGRVLPPHADDAVLQPGPEPVRHPEGVPRRGRRADDRGRGRGRRRHPPATASRPSATCAR